MMTNALLAFGIVLTTATQLRLPGVPLGVGEICLVLWLGLILLRQLTGGRVFNAASFAPSRPVLGLIRFCPERRNLRGPTAPRNRPRHDAA